VGLRALSIAALGSAILGILIAATWLSAIFFDLSQHRISWSPTCHFNIEARGMDARLNVFNDMEYGPYGGSIIYVEGMPNRPTMTGFGDTTGIYYRFIQWPDSGTLWTLSVSLAYPLLIASILPAVWIIRFKRHRL
jgi:hypothetical protein